MEFGGGGEGIKICNFCRETVSWLILHHGKGGKTFEGLLRFSDDNGKTPFMNLIKHMPSKL